MTEIKKIRTKLKILRDRIEELETALQKITGSYNSEYLSVNKIDKFEDNVIKLLELKEKYNRQMVLLQNEIDMFLDEIKNLPYPQFKVMYFRYVKGLKWTEVAKKSGYHLSHCFRLEKLALKKIKKIKLR